MSLADDLRKSLHNWGSPPIPCQCEICIVSRRALALVEEIERMPEIEGLYLCAVELPLHAWAERLKEMVK